MSDLPKQEVLFSIAAVERDTGLSKDTLRVWERRYGFPTPGRDAHGERAYSAEQVDKLRLVRRLLDAGRRPSQVVAASSAALAAMLEERSPRDASPQRTEREQGLLQLLRLHRSVELVTALNQQLLKQGLQRFVADSLAPLNEAVGEAWMRGEIDVPEEHLYTEQVQNLLRRAIGAHAVAGGRPRILLTTLPEEQHVLGLLMVEATLVPEGAACVSLGTQTPLGDIRRAAVSGGFDVVGLSFSLAFPPRQALERLQELRTSLPDGIELWAGGGALGQRQRPIPGVRVITDLADSLTALEAWRQGHPA